MRIANRLANGLHFYRYFRSYFGTECKNPPRCQEKLRILKKFSQVGEEVKNLDKMMESLLTSPGRASRQLTRLWAFHDIFAKVGEVSLVEMVLRHIASLLRVAEEAEAAAVRPENTVTTTRALEVVSEEDGAKQKDGATTNTHPKRLPLISSAAAAPASSGDSEEDKVFEEVLAVDTKKKKVLQKRFSVLLDGPVQDSNANKSSTDQPAASSSSSFGSGVSVLQKFKRAALAAVHLHKWRRKDLNKNAIDKIMETFRIPDRADRRLSEVFWVFFRLFAPLSSSFSPLLFVRLRSSQRH